MAQRGGTVISMVKVGPFRGPLIPAGEADVGLFLHPKNLAVHRLYLKAGGEVFVNSGAPGEYLNVDALGLAAQAHAESLDAALARANAEHKPIVVEMGAEWCKPCKAFETDIFSDPAVHAEITSRYVPVKFDVTADDDRDQAAKEAWNAPNLPTVIILAADGSEARRFKELPSRDEFLDAIRAVR